MCSKCQQREKEAKIASKREIGVASITVVAR
jgi:hypothetical protein